MSTSTTPGKRLQTFALVGNPNSGKTTLFNALTGLRQKVGNYPGVTVEKKEGIAIGQHGEKIKLIDLPGAYSMDPQSPDEEILRDVLHGDREDTPRPEGVICIVDASNAERHLYLATQVLDLGLPTIMVLNMTDIAENRKIRFDCESLSEKLGVPVIPMQANARKGLAELRIAMSRTDLKPGLRRILDNLTYQSEPSPSASSPDGEDGEWNDRLISLRYQSVRQLVDESIDRSDPHQETRTDRIDAWILHRLWGPLILVAILSLLFYSIFNLANIPMDWIDEGFGWLAERVRSFMPPGELRDLITDGIIAGVGGVVIFLPQIMILFFFIGIMEDTGYLSRVAFLMDRIMSRVGLNGRAFIPILSSYACAVPAIMGTRTIENPKDRLITIMVAPFASCSARLPVYLIMIALLIPGVSAWKKTAIMLGLYLLGTAGLFVFAWIFNRIFRHGERTPMIMELPSYKVPVLRAVLSQMWTRARLFLKKAGTVILGISILIWASQTFPRIENASPAEQQARSIAGRLGKAIEPAIQPLGYDWRIGIGILASFAAREVFVGTMRITFHVEEGDDENATDTRTRDQLATAKRDDGAPLFTPLVCISIMVFYVFAMQCASTLAIVKRETNSWRWPIFQFVWMTALAYLAALAVYQGGTWMGFT